MIISPYKNQIKITDYLNKYNINKVGILFDHGTADLFNVINYFNRLFCLYSHIDFTIYMNKAYRDYGLNWIKKWNDEAEKQNDVVFILDFQEPIVLSNGKVEDIKPVLCAKREVGLNNLDLIKNIPEFPNPQKSNIATLHFHSISNGFNDPHESIIKEIVNILENKGLTCIELNYHNPIFRPACDFSFKNKMFSFKSLYYLLSISDIFVGLNSGPMQIMTSINYKKILLLEKDLAWERYSLLPVKKININNFNKEEFNNKIKEILNES